MSDLVLDITTGVAIPAAAIIVSTWVAIGLARAERLAAAKARAEERADDAYVRALNSLATLNTINLRAESIAEPLRELRVGLTLLEATWPGNDNTLLGEWFEQERRRGLERSRESMRLLSLAPLDATTNEDVEAIVEAGAPLNEWARDFAQNLRAWRRSGLNDAQLADLIAAT